MADQELEARRDALVEETLDAHDDWEGVAAALSERGSDESLDVSDRTLAFHALAEVHRTHREDLAAAAEAFESLLEVDEGDQAAWAALREAYETLEDWESLSAVLVDLAGLAEDPAERAALLVTAAGLYQERLEQPDAARLLLEKAMADAPGEDAAWKALAELLGSQGAHGELAEVLSAHAARVAESRGDAPSVPILLAVAEAYGHASSPELAEAFVTRASLIAPEDDAVRAAQLDAYEASEDWEALAEVLAAEVEAAADGADQAALWRRLGRLRFEHLDDAAGAAEAFAKAHALSDDPEDADTLAALYEATEAFGPLLTLLNRRAETAEDAEGRIGFRMRAAEVARERLGDSQAALAAFRRVLEDAKDHPEANAAVEALLAAGEQWTELVAHLGSWADAIEDVAQRSAVRMRRAMIQESALQESAAAAFTVEQVHAEAPETEGAVEALIRLYTALDRVADTAPLQATLADRAASVEERVAARSAQAAALVAAGSRGEAIAAYEAALADAPDDAALLEALQALQAEEGDVAGAIASLQRRAELEADEAARVALLTEIATLQRESGDGGAAIATLESLLALAPETASARAAMAELLSETERWRALADHHEASAALSRDLGERAAYVAQAGHVLAERLDDADGAFERFERAIADDPTCLLAAAPLAEKYVADEAWERARPLLALLVENDADDDAAARAARRVTLARACEVLEQPEGAITAYEAALDLAPDDVDAAVALGGLYARAERFADADRIYRPLTFEQADAIPEAERVSLFFHAGSTASAVGENERAADLFGRALALDASHAPTLRAMAALDAAHDPSKQAEAREALLQVTHDPQERFKLLLEISDGKRDADDAVGAAKALRQALTIEPESKVALHKLLQVHTGAEQWEPAADVLVKLAGLEEDPERRDKLLFTVGAIYRDQLVDFERAQNVFDNLLDRDPLRMDAIEAIEALHRDRGAWKTLEKAYRRQLERVVNVEGSDDMRYGLAVALGRIYRDRLDRPSDATTAFKLAASIRPDDIEPVLAIAEIYPKDGKTDAETIAQHRAVVAIAPDRVDSHHLIFSALRRERRFDEAWTTASILTVLGERDPTATAFYSDHRPEGLAMARRALSREEWRAIQHPDLSPEATKLLAAIAASLRRVYAQELKTWEVHRRKDAIDTSRPAPVVNLFHYNAQLQGVALPQLFAWHRGTGFQNANAEPRAVLVGADMAAGADRKAVFHVARIMCLMRNEFYLASALAPSTLMAIVQACIALFTGGAPREWDTEPVRAWMSAIGEEPDELLAVLGDAVRGYLATGQPLNLKLWPRAVELTACRAGLLVSGDLQRAAQACVEVPRPLGDVDAHERVLDMVAFAATAEYSALRGALGIGIGQQ